MKKGEITQYLYFLRNRIYILMTSAIYGAKIQPFFFGKILFFEVLFFFHKIYSRKFRICWLIREQYFVIANYSDDKAPQGH